jgi:6-phosphofructokinase 1
VAHSGGPTAVLNASLLGVVEEARASGLGALYGARFGLRGLLDADFVDLFAQPAGLMEAVAEGPGSALGTSRLPAGPPELERVVAVLRGRGVRYLFYTGGNGSMGTAAQIADASRDAGYELQVIGIPKTIDNDLLETDHTPGYPTTARFFAAAARDIGADNTSLSGQVEILETLGRNTGWIAAATALARRGEDDPPHLIYLPEARLSADRLLADIDCVFRRLGRCMVVVCEGQLDEHGEPFGADVRGGSRGALASNLGHRLALLVTERLGLRARSEKPGLLGRSSAVDRPRRDWLESRMCGKAAVCAAADGVSGQMITLVRAPGPEYACTTGLAPLARVAWAERPFPPEWRHPDGNGVLAPFIDYLVPLTGPIPCHAVLP